MGYAGHSDWGWETPDREIALREARGMLWYVGNATDRRVDSSRNVMASLDEIMGLGNLDPSQRASVASKLELLEKGKLVQKSVQRVTAGKAEQGTFFELTFDGHQLYEDVSQNGFM